MSAKHTPGPWKHVPGTHRYEVRTDNGFDGEKIASLVQRVEDARLIAAAPDLLEMLKAITPAHGFPKCDRRCASIAPRPDEDPRCDCGWEEVRDKADSARAAIAKAEGK